MKYFKKHLTKNLLLLVTTFIVLLFYFKLNDSLYDIGRIIGQQFGKTVAQAQQK